MSIDTDNPHQDNHYKTVVTVRPLSRQNQNELAVAAATLNTDQSRTTTVSMMNKMKTKFD